MGLGPVLAQAPGANTQPSVAAGSVAIPGFWDPRRRPERPDTSRITQIRFLTEFDYPPFNYAGPDGNPAGFNVELARLICEELKISCTIQLRRFDTLLQALAENRADAVIGRTCCPHWFDRGDQSNDQRDQAETNTVDDRRSEQVKHAPEGRTGDAGYFEQYGIERHRFGKCLGRNEVGGHRLRGRH